MAETNEFDEAFGVAPVAQHRAPSHAVKKNEVVTPPEVRPLEAENEFDVHFSPDMHTPSGPSVTPISPEALAALAGGAAGEVFGKPAAISGAGPIARAAESIYGAPSGSLAATQELATPLSPDALSRRVAEQYVNPQGGVTEPRPTPGGRWAEKTGYGAGEGTVEDVVTRQKRRASHGKVSSALEKKFGVPKPGEPASLIERLAERSAAAETVQAQAEAQKIAAEVERVKTEDARRSTLDKIAENIRRAGGASGIAQQALRTGLNVGSGALGALHGFQGVSDIRKQGATPENVAQTAEGAALMYAMRNPNVGLPAAGIAGMYRAGSDMYKNGPSAENAAQMVSSAGLVAMPRAPVVGTALQVPALSIAAVAYLRAHPELIPAWLKSQNKTAPTAP